MRVLFLAPLPEPVTGHSLACQVFLDALVRKHAADVVDLNKADFRPGVSSLGRVFEVLGMAWRAFRRHRAADVIYFTISESLAGNLKDILIYMACFGRLSRMVIHLHGGAGMRTIMGGRYPLLASVNRFFLRRMGAVVVLGGRHEDMYRFSVAPGRLHSVANFAADDLFVADASVERKFAAAGPLRLLFLSNLLPGKGHLELLEAVASLPAELAGHVHIDFAGGFETLAQQAEFLERLRGVSNATYHGTVRGEAKAALLREAHLFCLPTYYPYEGQPISILEAYASGCAVMTTDHSGIFDVFEPGVNGLAVEKGAVASIRAALERAIADPQALRGFARTNLSQARERYTVARYTDELVAVVETVGAEDGFAKRPHAAIEAR